MNTASSPLTTTSFSTALPTLVLLTMVFFANFMARTLFGPLLLPISQEIGQTLAQTATVFLFLSGGYSFSVLCAGLLSARLGHKRVIVVSATGIGLGLLGLATTQNFDFFLAWTCFIGLSAGLYMPSGVVTITETTAQSLWGQAFAIHELGPNLSFILAPLLAELFVSTWSYPALLTLLGCACLGLALVYALRGPQTTRPGMPPNLTNITAIAKRLAFWIMVMFFVLAVGLEVGLYNLTPAFLVAEKGLSREQANIVLSCSRLLSLAFLPTAGWIIKRIGYRASLAGYLTGAALTTLLAGHGPLWWTIAMLSLQPVFVVSFFPVGFAVLALVCPRGTNDLSVSLTITCSSLLGGGLLPLALAWSGEHASFVLGFTACGAFMLVVSILGILGLHIPQDSPGA
ncbi:MAG: MFS transporter [Desulfovibrionales bacterium]|nr:MFS transporter [Desulfovibrionales bacterium]